MSKSKQNIPNKKKSIQDFNNNINKALNYNSKINSIDSKILKSIINMLNIREQFQFLSINTNFRNIILNNTPFNKYIKVRKEFIKGKVIDKKKAIIESSMPKPFKKIKKFSPEEYKMGLIIGVKKLESKKGDNSIDNGREKINKMIDFDKIIIEDLISNNYEKIKKISRKYNLTSSEENYIFFGMFESKILNNEKKENNNKEDNKNNTREKVKNLILNNKNIIDGINFIISPFINLEENDLMKIDLSGNQIKDIKLICNLIEINSGKLQFLNLSNNKIDDSSCKILFKSLTKCEKLLSLNLSSNKISRDGIIHSEEFLSNNISLQSLILGRNIIGPKGIAYVIQYLVNNDNMILRTLDISYNGLEIKGIQIVCEFFKINNKLISLFIGGNYICDEGTKILIDTIIDNSNCKITYLFLQNNNITSKGFNYISKIISYHPFLNSINLKSNNLSDEGVKGIFSSLNPESKLSTIDLSHNNINGNSIKYINDYIIHNSFLRQLFLDYNKLDKNACKLIKEMLSNEQSNLRIISLKSCKIFDNVNLIFEGLEQNKKLEIINLSKNEIGNYREQFEKITSCLKNNKALKEIILDSNFLDDKNLKMIIEGLKENKNLKSISLNENEFSKKTVSELFLMIEQNHFIKKCNLEKCGLSEDYLKQLNMALEIKPTYKYIEKEEEEKSDIGKNYNV